MCDTPTTKNAIVARISTEVAIASQSPELSRESYRCAWPFRLPNRLFSIPVREPGGVVRPRARLPEVAAPRVPVCEDLRRLSARTVWVGSRRGAMGSPGHDSPVRGARRTRRPVVPSFVSLRTWPAPGAAGDHGWVNVVMAPSLLDSFRREIPPGFGNTSGVGSKRVPHDGADGQRSPSV